MRRPKAFLALVALLLLAGVALLLVPRAGSTPASPVLVGTLLHGTVAPAIRLTDQFGQTIALRQLRGHPVLVTFLEAHCREVCPLVAEKLRRAVRTLGPRGRGVVILAVSTDPEGDTVEAVRLFSRTHHMLHRWHYLRGTRTQLVPTWRAYYVYAAPANAPPALRDGHTSATYLIDQHGRERVLFASDLNTIAVVHDLRILLGVAASLRDGAGAVAPMVGYVAPDIVLTDTQGVHRALSAFAGKVVLVNFWATYCRPCRTEMPRLARWYQRYRRQGFVVLGVDKQESRGDVQSFLMQLHIPYPVLLDDSGSAAGRYNIGGIPTSVLVDRNGIIRSITLGALGETYATTTLQPLLRAPAP